MVPSDLERCPREKRPGELRIFSCPEPACAKRFFATHDDRPSPSGHYGVTVPDLPLPRLAERSSIGDPDPTSARSPLGGFPRPPDQRSPALVSESSPSKAAYCPSLPALGTPIADRRFWAGAAWKAGYSSNLLEPA